MLQKLLDEDLVEEEIDRNAKTITIGERVIDYSTTIEIPIYDDSSMNNVAFYIDYEEGMTWREFIDSSYNNVGFFCGSEYVGQGGRMLNNSEGVFVRIDSNIEQTEKYFLEFPH